MIAIAATIRHDGAIDSPSGIPQNATNAALPMKYQTRKTLAETPRFFSKNGIASHAIVSGTIAMKDCAIQLPDMNPPNF